MRRRDKRYLTLTSDHDDVSDEDGVDDDDADDDDDTPILLNMALFVLATLFEDFIVFLSLSISASFYLSQATTSAVSSVEEEAATVNFEVDAIEKYVVTPKKEKEVLVAAIEEEEIELPRLTF